MGRTPHLWSMPGQACLLQESEPPDRLVSTLLRVLMSLGSSISVPNNDQEKNTSKEDRAESETEVEGKPGQLRVFLHIQEARHPLKGKGQW